MLEDVPELDALDRAGGRRRPDLRHRGGGQGIEARYRDLWRAGRTLSGHASGDARSEPLTEHPPAQTIAEGIAVKQPGVLTTEIVKALVTDILLVQRSGDGTCAGHDPGNRKNRDRRRGGGGLCRGAGNPALFKGRKVGIVMSGGNIDMRMLSNVILRELSREGRILTLDVAIADQPGAAVASRGTRRAKPAAISWKSPTTA